MKNQYNVQIKQWCLVALWVMGFVLSARAQTAQPPVIQGQQVIEGGVDANSKARVAKASNGEFGVLNGTALSRLTPSGTLRSVGAVEGSVVMSANPLEYSSVLRTSGLAPTADGGFLVLANDAFNLYLIKKDANANRVWTKIIAPSADQSAVERYDGQDLIQTADGGYLAFANHVLAGFKVRTFVSKFDGDGNLIWSREPSPETVQPGSPPSGIEIYKRLALPDGGYIQVGVSGNLLRRPWPDLGYAARFDAQGNTVWSREYGSFPVVFNDVILNPDGSGSFLAVSSIGTPYTILSTGDLAPGAAFPSFSEPRGRSTSIASDGSGQPFYVILDKTNSNGGDFRLTGFNQQNQSIWSRTLGGSADDTPQALLTTGDGYLLAGTTTSTDGDVKGNRGVSLATWIVKLTKQASSLIMSQPTYNCLSGEIIFNTSGGDGTLITFTAPGVSRSSATSNTGTVEQGLRNDPKPITITATQSGMSISYTFDFRSVCYNTSGGLTLFLSSYNCQTGAIVFTTTGGTGAPITYTAPGISRANPTDNFGIVEPGLRNDPKPITITAIQGGQSLSFTFDFGAYCAAQPPANPPVGGTLTLTAPTYDCASGAFTFRSSGGNGSPIEFMAIGITGWATNPNQFVDRESRTANDVQPFTLMARQNGQTVSLTWDLKAACGRSQSRLQNEETESLLTLTVLGNPVHEQLRVLIQGVDGQPVTLQLTDMRGRLVESRPVAQARAGEEQVFDLHQQGAGLLILRASSGPQQRTVKVLKQ